MFAPICADNMRAMWTLRFPDTHRQRLVRACRIGLIAIGLGAPLQGVLAQEAQINRTEARIPSLTAIDFARLPLQDAIVSRRGQGTRQLAVFADPGCIYCKQLEGTLQGRDDITVYTFLLPILGPGSLDKARAIWCSADRDAAWRDWMQTGTLPPVPAACDTSALDRNLALGRRHAIRGTPALVFLDGARITGAPGALELERRLAQHQAASPAAKQ
jgi:thiol:disulfide interchange protein DsbC